MKQFIKNINNEDVIKRKHEIIIERNGMNIFNPSEKMIIEDGWTEYIPLTPEPHVPTYEELVEQFIREKYSVSDELAILRQREVKQDEFNEYFNFCEECKNRAKDMINQ